MKKIYIRIEGIHCQNCVNKITNHLLKIKNIQEVKIDKSIAEITYTKEINEEDIIKCINDLDYITKKEFISQEKSHLTNKQDIAEYAIIFLCLLICFLAITKILGYNPFNVIPTIDENLSYAMLFITGLLTSVHCMSMCGAMNFLASINIETKINMKRPLLYNIGRLISYTIIGFLVGLVGNLFTLSNTVSGILILFSGILMLYIALNLMRVINRKLPTIKFLPKVKINNIFLLGLLNGLMPCGPLQSMQLYALSTGSPIKGALSMCIFGLGTIPLMCAFGLLINIMKGKVKIYINKIASVLVFVLALTMIQRGLLTLNINLFSPKEENNYIKSILKDDYQEVKIDLTYSSFGDIMVQKDIPVKFIINVTKEQLTNCNNELEISKYNVNEKLEVGENIIEFTPTEIGTYKYNCWMNMIINHIKVIDNKNEFIKE